MPYGMFQVDLPDKVSAGKIAKGEITLSDEYIDQEFEKSITVEVNDASKSRFTIPVKRVIRVPGNVTGTATSSVGSGH